MIRFPWISRQIPGSSIFLKGPCSKIHLQVQIWPEYFSNPTPQGATEDSGYVVPICTCFFMWLFSFSHVCVWYTCRLYACLFMCGNHIVWGHTYVCVPVETRGWCWKSSPIALLPYSIREGLSVNLELTDGTHPTSWLDLGIPSLTLRTELEAILTTLSSPSHGLLGSNPILMLTWQVLQPLIHLPNTHSHTYTPCLKHKPEGRTKLSTCGVHTVLGLYTFILPPLPLSCAGEDPKLNYSHLIF